MLIFITYGCKKLNQFNQEPCTLVALLGLPYKGNRGSKPLPPLVITIES